MSSREFYETKLRDRAADLGEARSKMAQEYILYVMSGVNTYQAQQQATVAHAINVALTEAEYEIAKERLRHAD